MENKQLEHIEFLINDEYEAIDGYDKSIEFFTNIDVQEKDLIIKQLNHIKDEEKEHIKELEELKKVIIDNSYIPKLDTLKESGHNKFTLKDAIHIAQIDADVGISAAIEELADKYNFDVSYYFNHVNKLDDVDSSGKDEETEEKYSDANIYYRDKQFEKLGISDLMNNAYDLVWEDPDQNTEWEVLEDE